MPRSRRVAPPVRTLLLFLILSSTTSVAQVIGPSSRMAREPDLREALGFSVQLRDTSGKPQQVLADTMTVVRHRKSALVAVLLSAVVPGGGQIYNGSYWKVPIILGVQAFFASQWIQSNKTYQDYRSQYSDSLAAGQSYLNFGMQQLRAARDAARDQRDSYAWYIAGTYLLTMLDAYVDAELSDFDVSPALGLSGGRSPQVTLALSVRF